jgi:hypothetical protein
LRREYSCLLAVEPAFKHRCRCQFLVDCLVDSLFRLQPNYFGGRAIFYCFSVDFFSSQILSPLNASL